MVHSGDFWNPMQCNDSCHRSSHRRRYVQSDNRTDMISNSAARKSVYAPLKLACASLHDARDKIRRSPAPHHHLPSIPHGLPVPDVLCASISRERSGQRPTLEECVGVEAVDLTDPDKEVLRSTRQPNMADP